jgi:hypothetical protein
MKKIMRAVMAALSIRRKDRAYGWFHYRSM